MKWENSIISLWRSKKINKLLLWALAHYPQTENATFCCVILQLLEFSFQYASWTRNMRWQEWSQQSHLIVGITLLLNVFLCASGYHSVISSIWLGMSTCFIRFLRYGEIREISRRWLKSCSSSDWMFSSGALEADVHCLWQFKDILFTIFNWKSLVFAFLCKNTTFRMTLEAIFVNTPITFLNFRRYWKFMYYHFIY